MAFWPYLFNQNFGVGSTTVDLSAISGYEFYLDANDETSMTLSTTRVDVWADTNGNGHNFTRTLGNPTLQTATGLTGNSVVFPNQVYLEGNQLLADYRWLHEQPGCGCGAFYYDSANGNTSIFTTGGSSNFRGQALALFGSQQMSMQIWRADFADENCIVDTAYPNAEWFIALWTWDPQNATPADKGSIRINNDLPVADNVEINPYSAGNSEYVLTLGRGPWYAPNLEIAGLAMFSSIPDASTQDGIVETVAANAGIVLT